jgi:hypothetical protein
MTSTPVPSGWYPDPSGARQWRVWTGSQWSELTRPYGEVAPAPSIATDLSLIQALHRLVRYGIAGNFAGIGILVSVLAHWPGTAHPVSEWFAVSASNVAVALVLIGSACFTQRLGGRPLRRVGAEVVLMALFIAQFHADTWLCVAPVIVAAGQSQWVTTLIDHLLTSSSPSSPIAS